MAAGCTARAHFFVIAAAAVVTMATTLFGASRIRLVNEGSSGPLHVCAADECAPAQTDNPSRKNLGWMDFYVLPNGCVELASVTVRPNGIGIDVACGPAEGTKRYRCQAGSCRPLEPSTSVNADGTRPIALPTDCGGRIHEVIVLQAHTQTPAAFIECDASSGPAGEM